MGPSPKIPCSMNLLFEYDNFNCQGAALVVNAEGRKNFAILPLRSRIENPMSQPNILFANW